MRLLSASTQGSRRHREVPLPWAILCLEARARQQVPCDTELQLDMERHGWQGMDYVPKDLVL